MTALEKQEANERKVEAYFKARCRCLECGISISLPACHWSHRIPKTKGYLEKYGDAVINHPMNMVITCSKCNSRVLLDPKTHRIEAQDLVDEINEDLRGE